MDSRKSNKIREIVRLQQILKKWKKLANNNNNNNNNKTTTITTTSTNTTTTTMTVNHNGGGSGSGSGSGSGCKSIKFLKKTLSFTESSMSSSSSMSNDQHVPKGYLAVCVGKEEKRFVIPMEYLGRQAFAILLREAEEEFGFQQEGVLKIPCEVDLFEKILKLMGEKRDPFFLNADHMDHVDSLMNGCYSSPDCDLTSPSHHPQMCR